VYANCLPFGKYCGQRLTDVPADYLRWLLRGADQLDHWLRLDVQAELSRRGVRFVLAAEVFEVLEEELTARVSEDEDLEHAAAGRLTDHVLEACEAVRRRYGIGQQTELVLAGRVGRPLVSGRGSSGLMQRAGHSWR